MQVEGWIYCAGVVVQICGSFKNLVEEKNCLSPPMGDNFSTMDGAPSLGKNVALL